MRYLIITIITLGMSACNLLVTEDDTFQCEKNAPIIVVAKEVCANAGGSDHSWNMNTNSESLQLSFVWGAGSFNLYFNTNNGRLIPGKYLYPGEVILGVYNLNKHGNGEVTITSNDTVNRVISGRFNLTAETATNYQANEYHVEGVFNKVSY
jgi:hypothetical protein